MFSEEVGSLLPSFASVSTCFNHASSSSALMNVQVRTSALAHGPWCCLQYRIRRRISPCATRAIFSSGRERRNCLTDRALANRAELEAEYLPFFEVQSLVNGEKSTEQTRQRLSLCLHAQARTAHGHRIRRPSPAPIDPSQCRRDLIATSAQGIQTRRLDAQSFAS